MQDILDHVTRRIEAATVVSEPFAHLTVRNILPDDFWETLKAAIPARDAFDDVGYFTHNLYFHIFSGMSAEHGQLARTLNTAHQHAIGLAVKKMMPVMGPQYVRSLCPDYDGPPLDDSIAFSVNPPNVCERDVGFSQSPHLDGAFRMMACYYYMTGPEDLPGLGTELYRVTGTGPDYSGLRNMFTRWPEDVEVEPFSRNDLADNTLFCFANSEFSFHGVPLLTEENLRNQRRLTLNAYVRLDQEFIERRLVGPGLKSYRRVAPVPA